MNLQDILKNIAKKSGINTEDDKFKAFFGSDALTAIDVPEDVVKTINAQLISISEAKNNHQDLKNHYVAPTLNAVDKTIDDLLGELGLTEDDDKNAIAAEKNSFKKIGVLGAQLKKKYEKLATAGSGDKKTLQDDIIRLNQEIVQAKQRHDALIESNKKDIKNVELRYAIDSMLSPHKTTFDTLPPAAKRIALQTLLQDDMRAKGLKFDFDDAGSVVLTKVDGSTYHENNEQVNAQQYTEKVLANNKLLLITPPNGQNGAGNNNGTSGPTNAAGNNGNQNGRNNAAGNNQNSPDKGAGSVWKEVMGDVMKNVATAPSASVV
jgi:hypothetical protein